MSRLLFSNLAGKQLFCARTAAFLSSSSSSSSCSATVSSFSLSALLLQARRPQSGAANSCSTIAPTTAVVRKEFEDGRVYEGRFDAVSGAPLPGSKLTDSGDVYVGEFNSAWQKHGRGKATLTDGTVYDGRFFEDELVEGTVRMADESGDPVVFKGILKDGQFVHGTLSHSDYSYTGSFENNEPHCTAGGVLKFATGGVQEGGFFRGQLHGDKCKWKLDSGQGIYIGTFMHGVITTGELRTATFTYEGEFNDRGQAHGVGRQEHHATSPKLVFRGHWVHGSLVTGQCHTDDGQPVDWHNDPSAQEQLQSKETRMQQSYMNQKFSDLREKFAESRMQYANDVETHFDKTGKRADKIDLGYEAGPVTGRKMAERQQMQAAAKTQAATSKIEAAAKDLEQQEQEMQDAIQAKQKLQEQKQRQAEEGMGAQATAELTPEEKAERQKAAVAPDISNWDIARAALMRQRGRQMTTADTLNDQFERFKLQREQKAAKSAGSAAATMPASSSSSSVTSAALVEDEFVVDPAPLDTLSEKPTKLRVDGNEPFVELSAKAQRN